MSDLMVLFVYRLVDFVLFIGPLILLDKLLVSIVGRSDIVTGVIAMTAIGFLLLIRQISLYQIDPKVGFFGGIKLGFVELKGYFCLLLGK